MALYRTKNEEDWRVVAHVTVLVRAFSEMDTELSNFKKLWTKRLTGNSPLSHTSHIQGVPSSFCYLQFGFGGRLFSRD